MYFIDGTIGIGKTSLKKPLSMVHIDKELVFLEEPFSQVKILKKFYDNKKRWAGWTQLSFQIERTIQLFQALHLEIKILNGEIKVVLERSIDTDYHVFAKTVKEEGNFDVDEYEAYSRWYWELSRKFCPKYDGIIYLRAGVERVMEFIDRSNREMEVKGKIGVTEDYIERLNKNYDEYICGFAHTQLTQNILTIDMDKLDFLHNEEDLSIVIARLEEFFNRT